MTQGVVPTFDPTSGASGGAAAAGGGDNFANVAWTTVDLTDGSWTLTDVDSLLDTNTAAGGYNDFVMNALAGSSTDYAWGSGTNQRAPRFSKPLVASDGAGGSVRINSDDTFILQVRMTEGSTASKFDTEIVFGGCLDPTGVTAGALVGLGAMMDYTAAGNTGYGAWAFAGKTTSAHTNNVYGVMNSFWAGRRAATTSCVTMKSDDTAQGNNSRNANSALTADTDMFFVFGVGTRGAKTITAGDDANVKVEYRVISFGVV